MLVGETAAVDFVEQEADGALMERQLEVRTLEGRRQMLEADGLVARKRDDLIEDAGELSQVAGPAVSCEGVANASRKEGNGTVPALLQQRGQELFEEAFSARERRQTKPGAYPKAMQQVLAELAVRNVLVEVVPRRRDNAYRELPHLSLA